MKKQQQWWLALFIVLIIVLLDQWTKHYFTTLITINGEQTVNSFFNLVLWHNKGAAFSFLANSGGWQRWFFVILTTAVICSIIVWIFLQKQISKLLFFGLIFVIGGALGNLIDRLYLGYVIDFLDFHFNHYHWPAFNIADSAIFMGVVCILLDGFVTQDES